MKFGADAQGFAKALPLEPDSRQDRRMEPWWNRWRSGIRAGETAVVLAFWGSGLAADDVVIAAIFFALGVVVGIIAVVADPSLSVAAKGIVIVLLMLAFGIGGAIMCWRHREPPSTIPTAAAVATPRAIEPATVGAPNAGRPRGPPLPPPNSLMPQDQRSHLRLDPQQPTKGSDGNYRFGMKITNESSLPARATYSFSVFVLEPDQVLASDGIEQLVKAVKNDAQKQSDDGVWGAEFDGRSEVTITNPGAVLSQEKYSRYREKALWVVLAFVAAYQYNDGAIYYGQRYVVMDPISGGFMEIPGQNFSKHPLRKDDLNTGTTSPSKSRTMTVLSMPR